LSVLCAAVPIRVIDPEGPADPPVLDDVVARLQAGECVVVPTDTVYGLAAALTHAGAVARLAELKGRDRSVPIAVLVADGDQAAEIARLTGPAEQLARQHWPGALTLVVDAAPGVAEVIGADDGSVGVRSPDHPFLHAVAQRVGPLATTSANVHGQPTPARASDVAAQFPTVALVVDGGPCEGEPSTVVDVRFDPVRVLRRGPVRVD
jgi:tRNA threonylcarbamoyl adenosine modification protein (Sua5/YciO/YrdC/YwlC family)